MGTSSRWEECPAVSRYDRFPAEDPKAKAKKGPQMEMEYELPGLRIKV